MKKEFNLDHTVGVSYKTCGFFPLVGGQTLKKQAWTKIMHQCAFYEAMTISNTKGYGSTQD